jgi:hypothetical protein
MNPATIARTMAIARASPPIFINISNPSLVDPASSDLPPLCAGTETI